jgi:hypothetical protein
MKMYRYIGPKRIADRIGPEPAGVPVRSPDDVRRWVRDAAQGLVAGSVIATFVVDTFGVLRIADRRSEHVACAGGQPVRSAGEITFAVEATVEVVVVSNQSTGYCPEPQSWPAVAAALSAAGLEPPPGFIPACVFRRCPACGNINVVKDDLFECGVCAAELPAAYNCQASEA